MLARFLNSMIATRNVHTVLLLHNSIAITTSFKTLAICCCSSLFTCTRNKLQTLTGAANFAWHNLRQITALIEYFTVLLEFYTSIYVRHIVMITNTRLNNAIYL